MIKFLINRPIAVFMAFTASFILGIITYLNIPVSLLPDIAIPEITVQIAGKNTSARELENTVVTPIRQQLLQVSKLRDVKTETGDESAIIRLSFEYGADTDLAFIEVNEKIDAAMNYLPRNVDRPRVVKASATDIPVFNLNMTLKNDSAFQPVDEARFLDLCEFSNTVIKRRIEQLPQVAMVDITGLVNKQITVVPNNNQLEILGLSLNEIEAAMQNNNIEPGNMTIKDGHYEYNVTFSTVMRTVEDIQNIYIRKNDKILQLKDIAEVRIAPQKERGMSFYNGKRAITLAIIKQSDENMGNMQNALSATINDLTNNYPDVEFNISQNQTELLDYTISNLQQNLILAFIFVCLVSAFFLKDVKSPFIIGLSMSVSLVISLLFFYLFHISLNVVSLTGLILALGMMIDSSIIVTDNIGQYRKKGMSIDDACVTGTNEVIAPMLSSSLTTISVFVPLVFLSGIAGAIFFDQAFSVTVGLLVSYITGIMLLPVLYKLIYSMKTPKFVSNIIKTFSSKKIRKYSDENQKTPITEKIYNLCIDWIFKHKALTIFLMIAVLPLCALLFTVIRKEKMPDISQNELLVNIEWNENIHINENANRTVSFLQTIDNNTIENSALIGEQQFLLNREREQSVSEAQIYLKVPTKEDLPEIKENVGSYFKLNYPQAIISFSPIGSIFEKIFVTSEADLIVEYYTKTNNNTIDAATVRHLEDNLIRKVGEIPAGVSFKKQLNLHIDREKLFLYNFSYNDILQALKSGFKENQITTLRSYQQYLPIMLGNDDRNVEDVINNTLVLASAKQSGTQNNKVALSTFVSITPAEDLKTIVAGRNGEYIPFSFYQTAQVENIIKTVMTDEKNNAAWDIDFSGSFFSNRKMLGELLVILFISIMLMYFILAAQFENFVLPLIILLEIPIDIAAALGLLIVLGHSLNLMSAIGIVVTCGIIINDSILKVDIMNQLRKEGMPLMDAIHESGKRRLNAILMTSLTSIVCMAPLLFSGDMGSELEKPLAIATIGGMVIGTPVSLFVVPLVYWWIFRKQEKQTTINH